MNPEIELAKRKAKQLQSIEKYGIMAQGKMPMMDYLSGKTVHRADAVLAYCYSCMSFYADGKGDCGDPLCPLYPWMPYRSKEVLPI
jgi:hypothetical protein